MRTKTGRKITALLLTAVMLITLLPAMTVFGEAGAAQNFFNSGGRIPNVDYTRIPVLTNAGAELKIPVTFSVGNIDFRAFMQYGKTLSPEEQDAIIKGCMLECELTSDRIGEGNSIIREAKKNKGFDPQIIWKIVMNTIFSAAPDSIGNTATLTEGYAAINAGTGDVSDINSNIIIGTTFGTLIGMGFEGVAGLALKVLVASGKDIASEVIRLLQESETARRALEYEVLFEHFYSLCNDKLTEAMKDENGWHITGKNTRKQSITVFGSPVTQFWTLEYDLKKVAGGGDDPLNWNGHYEGPIRLSINHDTSAMDEGFLENVYKPWDVAKKIAATGSINFYDRSTMSSELWKRLRSDKAYFIISAPEGKDGLPKVDNIGMQLDELPLSGFKDNSGFLVIHKILHNPKIMEQVLGQGADGTWSKGLMDGSMSQYTYLAGEMSDDYRYPYYMFIKAEIDNHSDTHVAHGGHVNMDDMNEIGFGTMVARDTTVYKELRDGYIRLSFGWKGW